MFQVGQCGVTNTLAKDKTAWTYLKYRTLTALNPFSPNLADSAIHASCMIASTIPFVLPYADSGWIGDVSGIGMVLGVPYTVAEEEKTKFFTLCRSIACDRSAPYAVLTALLMRDVGMKKKAYLEKSDGSSYIDFVIL